MTEKSHQLVIHISVVSGTKHSAGSRERHKKKTPNQYKAYGAPNTNMFDRLWSDNSGLAELDKNSQPSVSYLACWMTKQAPSAVSTAEDRC